MTKILLTGGGTAGHVMGNLAILPGLKERGYDVVYVGSKKGIEKGLIEEVGLPYYAIASGKLRRFLSWENFTDAFRVVAGVRDAFRVLKNVKPDVIFSKGGYVTVPVAMAAAMLKIPFIGHESDITPGLANKIASRFAKKMLVTFPETRDAFGDKGVVVGSPVRPSLFTGSKASGRSFLGFHQEKPILLVMGGSLGSERLNRVILENLDGLLEKFQIVHLTGKGNLKDIKREGYRPFEYISKEMGNVLMCADYVVSRAGSNSIFEFLALQIPNLLIPLDYDQSRGDQVLNSQSFEKAGYSILLREKDLNTASFNQAINQLIEHKQDFIDNMATAEVGGAVDKILAIIDEQVSKSTK